MQDCHLTWAQHDRVLLKGKSGSGKTLLIQILAGIYDIKAGELYINDISLSNYRKESLYSTIGVCLPINQIFEGTIRENITMGRSVREEEFANIVGALNLWDYIVQQPLGVDSILDSGGTKIAPEHYSKNIDRTHDHRTTQVTTT